MPDPFRETDVLVIGGGAAGLMCAMTAAARGRSVALVEHQERIGNKILISGGGRCNFTNLGATPENYLSAQPEFCKSALARYTPWHFVELVEKHGIAYHEKKLGQQFCDGSSKEIVAMLLRECADAGVEVHTGCKVEAVAREGGGFTAQTSLGTFEAASLVIATGGLSFPKIGATDFGYRIAQQFGLEVLKPRSGLVPLTWEEELFVELSGVSLPVVARHGGASFEENILFTHRGLSGPAILQISSYWKAGETLHLDLLPGVDAAAWLREKQGEGIELATLLAERLPRRFAQLWCARHIESRPMNQYKKALLEEIGRFLNHWPVTPTGTEGYAKAEVTLGGVSTAELSSKTMEARRLPGLYFIGEVVDVTGWLGGYNFQWAWASGHAAGEVA
jgi:predicted Rossmann fold flavoprotein